MGTLNSIECFLRTAEAGSFSEAARRLGLTSAAVGKNVARLEQQTGVRLFNRSTRRLALTEAGQRFLDEVSGGMDTIQAAIANVAAAGGEPAGTLRVSMGSAFGLEHVLPLLGDFLARYPRIVPDWQFNNRAADLIGEQVDAAIGGGFALPEGMVARQLAPAHRVVVAAPAYLAQQQPIARPQDLADHKGILVRSPQSGRLHDLPLRNSAGDQAPVELQQSVVVNDPEAVCRLAAAGMGVAVASLPQAAKYLDDGSLARVLPDWYVDAGMLAIYYPARELLPMKTRVFVDFVLAWFRERDLARRFSAVAARMSETPDKAVRHSANR